MYASIGLSIYRNMNNITEKEALCFLQSIKEFQGKKIPQLKNKFGSLVSLVTADEVTLSEMLDPDCSIALLKARENISIADTLKVLNSQGTNFYITSDTEYPESLRSIASAPQGIYVKGKLPDTFLPKVAIIGARNCSAYGSQMTKAYAKELARNHIPIISGMARGVDGIAESAAIEAGGYVCSVLGCGIDICYPKENRQIYDECLKSGCIISEYPPGTAPHPRLFPPRNRIISGLSDAILVMEARERSGTLITVNMALDQGRDIYALPGRTCDSLSYGCNMLIREGATPLITPELFLDEFLERFNLARCDKDTEETNRQSHASQFLTADERLVMSVLDFIPKSISEIYCSLTDKTSMSIPSLMQLLTHMTMQHKIKCIDGNNYYLEND